MKQLANDNQTRNPATQCRNCGHPFAGEMKYCPSCGQKNTDGKASLMEVLSVFSVPFLIWSRSFL